MDLSCRRRLGGAGELDAGVGARYTGRVTVEPWRAGVRAPAVDGEGADGATNVSPRPPDEDEQLDIQRTLDSALSRGLIRQYRSLDALMKSAAPFVDTSSARAKILESFADPVPEIYALALCEPTPYLRTGIYHVLPMTAGGQRGLVLVLVMDRGVLAEVAKGLSE
jgi:hypothetical protein